MRLADLSGLATQLNGVAERRRNGLLEWRYRGRLVARQLDHSHVVIRASFDFKDFLLQSFPQTFSVPTRYRKHMMIVADLEAGNADAVEDAIIGAWELQSASASVRDITSATAKALQPEVGRPK
jgi:hypothetical protein